MVIIIDPNIKEISYSIFTSFNKKIESKHIRQDMKSMQDFTKLMSALKEQPRGKIKAISLRIIWSGELFESGVVIDTDFINKIDELLFINPSYFIMIKELAETILKEFSDIPLFAFFETSFFNKLPNEEKNFAIANALFNPKKIIRYGFHGIWHEYCAAQYKNKRILSIVLDKHTTVCAISDNMPQSINLGSSPLEGIMGEKTCGDIDPGIVFFLMKELKLSIFEIDSILKKESGFLGVSGFDEDLPALVSRYASHKSVALAIDIYINQILKYIGYGISLMQGVDTILFSGRYIDSVSPLIFKILKQIGFLGITLLPVPWGMDYPFTGISSNDSEITVAINHLSIHEILFKESLKYLTVNV